MPEDRPNKMVHGDSVVNRDKKRSKVNLAADGEDIFEHSQQHPLNRGQIVLPQYSSPETEESKFQSQYQHTYDLNQEAE